MKDKAMKLQILLLVNNTFQIMSSDYNKNNMNFRLLT